MVREGLPEEGTLGQGPEEVRGPAMDVLGGSVCPGWGDSMCKGPAQGCAQPWWDAELRGLGRSV